MAERFELTRVTSREDPAKSPCDDEKEPLTSPRVPTVALTSPRVPTVALTSPRVPTVALNGTDLPPGYEDVQMTWCSPTQYERIQQHHTDDTIKAVHFQRSQSLGHIGSDDRLNRNKYRRRIQSGASQTAERMRHVSRRFSTIGEADENQERGNWSNPIEFFLSCLGYAVGLGNVWRFPYLCYSNGGGAFLIPYLVMLFGCGLPLMFLELAIGQYSSQGPLTIWNLCPPMKGLGIGMVICSTLVAIYYNMITGWALYYLAVSVREHLPWACCEPEWSTENCVSFAAEGSCATSANTSQLALDRKIDWGPNSTAKFAADEYFHRRFLRLTEGMHETGGLHWELALSLFVAWVIVFLVLMKAGWLAYMYSSQGRAMRTASLLGIKSVGKTVYFTSTFPYLVLTALLVNAATKPGAIDGVLFFLTPKWKKLLEAKVWGDAASQIFYSTGVCFGGTITLASYNQFRNNLYRDAIIVALGNSMTSIFSGFVVFSILGSMAYSQNATIEQVATSGPGLTFITYPQAVILFPASPVWSFLFFFMLLTLALSTMFPTTENITTSIIDQFPGTLRPYKLFVTAAVCFVFFLAGLPLCTGAGMYVLTLMDGYGVGYALLVLGFVEIMVVAWIYGANRLLDDINTMIGFRPSQIWFYIWTFLTPTLLVFAICFTVSQLKPQHYGAYTFTPFWDAFGWFLTSLSLLPIVIYAVYYFVQHWFDRDHRGATGLYKVWFTIKGALQVNEQKWGPALVKYKFAGHQAKDTDDDVFA